MCVCVCNRYGRDDVVNDDYQFAVVDYLRDSESGTAWNDRLRGRIGRLR